MRTIKSVVALACVSGALLFGAAAPAAAAPPVATQGAVWLVGDRVL